MAKTSSGFPGALITAVEAVAPFSTGRKVTHPWTRRASAPDASSETATASATASTLPLSSSSRNSSTPGGRRWKGYDLTHITGNRIPSTCPADVNTTPG